MKKLFTILSFIACTASTVFGQITIDGNLNEAAYTTLATRGTSAPSFGAGIDATSIKVAQSSGVVYIGVTGFLPDMMSDANAIGLMLNFTSTSHPSIVAGAAAGTNLNFPAAVGAIKNYMNYHFKTGFEVDYLFALNSGSSPTNCYVNAGKKVGTPAEFYLGDAEQGGLPILVNAGNGTFFASPGVDIAFKRDLANPNAGFEMKIPFSALGLPNTAQLSVQAFAFVVSPTGYYSNITIPGLTTNANNQLGQDGLGNFKDGDPAVQALTPINFGTIAGGPYYSTFTVIPVEMTNFDATAAQNTVKLNWLTASEKNNGYFDVERSGNGRDFSKIGQVKGNGTTAKLTKYAFVDESPLATVNYYRLKQVDNDGKSSYSATVSVNVKASGKQLSIFPNPANDRLNIASDRFDTEGSLEIYDLAGRLVLSNKMTASQLDISRLNAGLYQLRLLDKTGAVVNQARFSKN